MKRRALLSWEGDPDEASVFEALTKAFPELRERLAFKSAPEPGDYESGFRRALPFSTMLSHELKASLNAVEGYLRMMDSRDAGEAISAYDRMIKRSLSRLEGMRETLEDVVDLAKAASGDESKRKFEDVDLNALARAALAPLLDQIANRGLKLSREIPEGLRFRAVPGELRIVLSNLLSNAVKYNRSGGSIRLSIHENDGILDIKVADTGIGVPPEARESLGGDFVRIKSPETREIPGSGLGLSIVKRIAALYDGALSIESERGEGSQFSVTLKEPPASA
jgi:signal transduction histidine kinase